MLLKVPVDTVMRMASNWILILSMCEIYAARAVDIYQRQSFVSTKPGEAVTLQCTLADHQNKEDVFWYKQPLGQMPQEVGIKGAFMEAILSPRFQNSGFKLERIENSISLTIPNPTKDDEGMYYCGISVMKMIQFSNGTFLSVTDHPQLNISVLQTQAQGSVYPGESVTLQCTVISEIRAADLRVLWFRATAGQSFPEIIYTHQNSSSHQCEMSSSTHSSVYSFSRNILNHHHTGTYYCAVAACGRISIGNGAAVEMRQPQDLTLIFLSAALVVCVVVISAQAFLICKKRSCEPCSDKMSQFVLHNIPEELHDQDPEAEDFIFAPLNFYVKKRLLLKENVFTRVGFLPVSDYRSIKKDDVAKKIRN